VNDKQLEMETVKSLPDDVGLDEILEEISIAASIRAGIEDVEAGRVLSHEEVMRRIAASFRDPQ